MRMPNAAAAAKKWKDVTPGRQTFYSQGVAGAAAAYDEGVRGAGDRYAAGVQTAISNGLWGINVEGKGSRFAQRASTVGGPRWSDGVSRGESDYASHVQPYFAALGSIQLPMKGPKGHPGNYARSQAVGDALHAMKIRS